MHLVDNKQQPAITDSLRNGIHGQPGAAVQKAWRGCDTSSYDVSFTFIPSSKAGNTPRSLALSLRTAEPEPHAVVILNGANPETEFIPPWIKPDKTINSEDAGYEALLHHCLIPIYTDTNESEHYANYQYQDISNHHFIYRFNDINKVDRFAEYAMRHFLHTDPSDQTCQNFRDAKKQFSEDIDLKLPEIIYENTDKAIRNT